MNHAEVRVVIGGNISGLELKQYVISVEAWRPVRR